MRASGLVIVRRKQKNLQFCVLDSVVILSYISLISKDS